MIFAMIHLTRDRAAIHSDFLNPDRRANLLELYREAQQGNLGVETVKKTVFNSKRWGKAKPQLEVEASQKCAFCETPNSAAYYGDIEHFRPKSIYWWLAYCYDNMLYSCRVCNGKKSNKYAFAGAGLPAPVFAAQMTDDELLQLAAAASPEPQDAAAVAQFAQVCTAEQGHLPNPYEIDPEPLFAWEADEVLREVRIAPRDGSQAAQLAFDAAVNVIDLNRDELLYWRWLAYEHLVDLRDLAGTLPVAARDGVLDIIRSLTQPNKPYSAMMRYFAEVEWQII